MKMGFDMAPTLSEEEKEDLTNVMGEWLGMNDIHDMEVSDFTQAEADEWEAFYLRVGRLFYAFTGRDYLCGHGYITNYEGRELTSTT